MEQVSCACTQLQTTPFKGFQKRPTSETQNTVPQYSRSLSFNRLNVLGDVLYNSNAECV